MMDNETVYLAREGARKFLAAVNAGKADAIWPLIDTGETRVFTALVGCLKVAETGQDKLRQLLREGLNRKGKGFLVAWVAQYGYLPLGQAGVTTEDYDAARTFILGARD